MSFLIASSELLASAATGLADIGTTISAANGAASPATTGMMPAAADEVSQAIAALFSGHGRQFQALSAKVALFHDEFVRTLTGSAASYGGAEAANVSSVGGVLQQLEQGQIAFNTNLVNGELGFNHSLLTNEVGLEQRIFGTDSALNGVINRGYNVANLLLGTGEQSFNTVVGAQVPATFWSSLLTGSGAQVFNGGQIGGLVGAFDQSLAGTADLAGLFVGDTSPMQAGLAAVNVSGAHAVSLASVGGVLQQLEQGQIAFNTNLVNGELGFNHSLLTNEVGLEQRIFGTDSALNGVINRGYNVANLLLGTGEQSFNTVVGAQVPATFWSSLLTGSGAQVFNGGQIGGLVGAFDQSLAGTADLAGLFVGDTSPMQAGLAAVNVSGAHAVSLASVGGVLQQLEQGQIAFNTNLVNGELGFNHSLLTNEVGLEQRIFGTDSALNGVINRGYNVANLLLGTGEQSFNTVVGAQVPATFWSSLLTGSGAQVFNGGQIGGLVGAFDQSLAGTADLIGLLLGDT